MEKRRYVQVGTGGRARMFYEAIATIYRDSCELVGFCDQSPTRMKYANRVLRDELDYAPVPMYSASDFEIMLDKEKPDYVIVTTIDRTHHDFIIRSLKNGCNVITEKPITTDERKARAIIEIQEETNLEIRVAFNYRYAPHHTKIRELITNGEIGQPFSVHFEWLLNTQHGADYYRRWHRNKVNSGGLLVHKSTHHFDLVNFWLGTQPEEVFAFGALNFYGRAAAEARGVEKFYDRCHGKVTPKEDPFAIDLESNPTLKGLYLDAEADSGYIRDRSVFADDISIEDTMAVLVRYKNGAMMTYSLNTYMPWEGFNIAINGSKGRIEFCALEKPYINAGGDKEEEGVAISRHIRLCPLFEAAREISVENKDGGHGGGDPAMLDDIFSANPQEDRFTRAADHSAGIQSILTGIAANKSIASGRPVHIDSLLSL